MIYQPHIVFLLFGLSLLSQLNGLAQQAPDTLFYKTIDTKTYEYQQGPIIFIDEGHHNFHTKGGRYKPFAQILEKDGYLVKPYEGTFKKDNLEKAKILVISNALNQRNADFDWSLPTPSAFTEGEIAILEGWVREGGSLLLIADHMPFPGAAQDLAASFGFEFYNGFAIDSLGKRTDRGDYLTYFNRTENTLNENIISRGRNEKEQISEVVTFTGQAFKIPEDAVSILNFDENCTLLLPDTSWRFNAATPEISIDHFSQGAFKRHGKGKIAVFGEASVFTAQLKGPNKVKMGMNSALAPENYKLLLNTIHWLDGILEED